MKKFLIISLIVIVLGFSAFYAFVYFFTLSEGDRSGKLVKFSNKGTFFKTYEGTVSQGDSDQQIFDFSVLDSQDSVIETLKSLQGQNVKLHYKERFRTFAWWGDTRHFVSGVEEIQDKEAIKENNLEEELKLLEKRVSDLEIIVNSLFKKPE